MDKQQRCPKCQQLYPPSDIYCAQDGTPLVGAAEPSAAPADPLLGQILDDRYRLDRLLGIGGMGRVYRAEHMHIGKVCAIKILHRDLQHDDAAVKRFHREARAISAIDHPHIVEIYDYGQTSYGLPFLVMEYAEGVTLRAYLDASPGGVMPLNQAVHVAMQVAQALQHIHDRGIVHRDIKPDNIQLTVHPEHPVFVKLFDFGIARIQNQAAVTRIMSGPPRTVAYAAPEMLQRADYLSPAIDVYALGITLFEIITKQRPFGGNDMQVQWNHLQTVAPLISKSRPDLHFPGELETLIAQMLEKQPELRPTAGAVAERLAAIMPKLRSVSMRSLHYLRTYVLPKNQSEREVHKAPAVPAAGQPRNVTQVLATLQNIDDIEAGMELVSEQIDRESKGIIKRIWARTVPPKLAELLLRSAELEAKKSEFELDLAVLRDELARENAVLRSERNSLRQKLQAVREQSRDLPAAVPESAMAQELSRLERAYLTPEQPTALAEKLEQQEALRHQLCADLWNIRRDLADSLLIAIREYATKSSAAGSARDDGSLGVYAQRLVKSMSRFDALSASLGKV